MVTEKGQRELSAKDTALCTSCQMLVVWIQNQLKQKKTKEIVCNVFQVNNLSFFQIFAPTLFEEHWSCYAFEPKDKIL